MVCGYDLGDLITKLNGAYADWESKLVPSKLPPCDFWWLGSYVRFVPELRHAPV